MQWWGKRLKNWNGLKLGILWWIWTLICAGLIIMSNKKCFIKCIRGRKSIIFLAWKYCRGRIIWGKTSWPLEIGFLMISTSFPIHGCCPTIFRILRTTMITARLERHRLSLWNPRLTAKAGASSSPGISTVWSFLSRAQGRKMCRAKIPPQAIPHWWLKVRHENIRSLGRDWPSPDLCLWGRFSPICNWRIHNTSELKPRKQIYAPDKLCHQ